MRSNRGPRAQNADSASLLPLRSAGTPNRSNLLRRMNARLRYALLFSLAIALTVLIVNLIIIRIDRPANVLKLVGNRVMQSEEYGHTEPDDAILERLRHGYNRPVMLPERIVHLDLKGAPLTVNYMEQVFPLLKRLGATGVLIEYEDMFPYRGDIRNISAKNCYSVEDVKIILETAKANELSIIPLVQTFGHLEFILKLEEFAHLREVAHNPQALCPSKQGSTQLVHQMLKQIADLHREYITHIHVGSDEVFALGECETCLNRLAEKNWQRSDLFLSHVTKVVEMVRELGFQAIIWDDMFRNVEEDALRKSPLAKQVEIMVWNYSKNVNLVGTFAKYVTAGFRGLWIASAFKGALGPVNQMPEYKLHVLNHHSWIQLIKQFEDKIQVKGIAITGWQRFDHFGSLCELFPVGIPVLAVCLAYLQTGRLDEQVLGKVKTLLNCNRNIFLIDDSMSSMASQSGMTLPMQCDFPGSRVFADVLRWDELRQRKKQVMSTNYIVGWMSPMNQKRQFSSPEHVIQGTRDLYDVISQVSKLAETISSDLLDVTDAATAKEWVETFIDPMKESFDSLLKSADTILTKKYWPRRPIYDTQ